VTAATIDNEGPYVIRVEVVRECIAVLREQRIHSFFPAYLHLRRQAAARDRLTDLTPNWNELGTLLEVPGGPFGRPYFRPFWPGPAQAGQEWLNPNLAGSYAPSSIRELPRRVIDIQGGKFSLRPRHWELAREHLADNRPVPVLALAGFFLRDFGLVKRETPSLAELIAIFRQEFGYRDGIDNEEFDYLYDQEWQGSSKQWFEPFHQAATT